tara:strand:+ start:43 stop:276 length:234 start_codon:yes stop_codon:yes gene_type:complete
MLFKKIFDIKYFIIGLIIGFILVLLYPINKKEVIVYPNNENKGYIQYRDMASNCFEAEVEELECPKNPSNVKIIPIQ